MVTTIYNSGGGIYLDLYPQRKEKKYRICKHDKGLKSFDTLDEAVLFIETLNCEIPINRIEVGSKAEKVLLDYLCKQIAANKKYAEISVFINRRLSVLFQSSFHLAEENRRRYIAFWQEQLSAHIAKGTIIH